MLQYTDVVFHCLPVYTLLSPVLVAPTTEEWPGWGELGGWLNTEMVWMKIESTEVTYPSTNSAWRRVSLLINTNG